MKKITIADFKRWVMTLDDERKFNYTDIFGCPFASFLKETGICSNPQVSTVTWSDADSKKYVIPPKIAVFLIEMDCEMTGKELKKEIGRIYKMPKTHSALDFPCIIK